MKLNELAGALAAVNEKLQKAREEILAKISELQLALEDIDIPPDAQAALDAVVDAAKTLDDVVPDAQEG